MHSKQVLFFTLASAAVAVSNASAFPDATVNNQPITVEQVINNLQSESAAAVNGDEALSQRSSDAFRSMGLNTPPAMRRRNVLNDIDVELNKKLEQRQDMVSSPVVDVNVALTDAAIQDGHNSAPNSQIAAPLFDPTPRTTFINTGNAHNEVLSNNHILDFGDVSTDGGSLRRREELIGSLVGGSESATNSGNAHNEVLSNNHVLDVADHSIGDGFLHRREDLIPGVVGDVGKALGGGSALGGGGSQSWTNSGNAHNEVLSNNHVLEGADFSSGDRFLHRREDLIPGVVGDVGKALGGGSSVGGGGSQSWTNTDNAHNEVLSNNHILDFGDFSGGSLLRHDGAAPGGSAASDVSAPQPVALDQAQSVTDSSFAPVAAPVAAPQAVDVESTQSQVTNEKNVHNEVLSNNHILDFGDDTHALGLARRDVSTINNKDNSHNEVLSNNHILDFVDNTHALGLARRDVSTINNKDNSHNEVLSNNHILDFVDNTHALGLARRDASTINNKDNTHNEVLSNNHILDFVDFSKAVEGLSRRTEDHTKIGVEFKNNVQKRSILEEINLGDGLENVLVTKRVDAALVPSTGAIMSKQSESQDEDDNDNNSAEVTGDVQPKVESVKNQEPSMVSPKKNEALGSVAVARLTMAAAGATVFGAMWFL